VNVRKALKTAIKAAAWRVVPRKGPYLAVRTLFGPCRGLRLQIDLRYESSYWLGTYDRRIVARIRDWVRPGDVAWDCGAFLGYYGAAMRLAAGSAGEVHLFEASSTNFERTALLPRSNGWGNVFAHPLAVGEEHARIRFAGSRGGGSGPVDMPGKNLDLTGMWIEEVESAGIDELVYERGFRPPDFMKFDLETAECFALANGARLWREQRPVLLVELHHSNIGGIPPAFVAAETFLRTFDYTAIEVHRNVPVATSVDLLRVEATGTQCMILATPR
jgi:FkbM family methyltransferase